MSDMDWADWALLEQEMDYKFAERAYEDAQLKVSPRRTINISESDFLYLVKMLDYLQSAPFISPKGKRDLSRLSKRIRA